MANNITFNFSQATITAANCVITVTAGAFELDTANALTISGTVTFNSLYVTTGAVNFGVNSGASINATVTVPLSIATGATPTVMVTNFSGTASVTYPTATGLVTEPLASGNALALAGYVA